MNDNVLCIRDLNKKYNGNSALDHFDMQVKQGDIYGFIGENGAGKTTTIRILTGLATADSGEIELFGERGEANLLKQRRNIGCIIEAPSLYPELTAIKNLEVQRIQRGIKDKNQIKQILEIVGLEHAGKRKARDFSLGMKQRLGIAIALLGNPKLLLLDEPTNGLDPMGIIELRNLLRHLNEVNKITIVISSHILSELHQVASCYGIIHKGRMMEQISNEQMDEKCKQYIKIGVTDVEKAVMVIKNELQTNNFEIIGDGIINLSDYLDDIEMVAFKIYEAGIGVTNISLGSDNLESYFKKIIGKSPSKIVGGQCIGG